MHSCALGLPPSLPAFVAGLRSLCQVSCTELHFVLPPAVAPPPAASPAAPTPLGAAGRSLASGPLPPPSAGPTRVPAAGSHF